MQAVSRLAVVQAPLLQAGEVPSGPCVHPGINKFEPVGPNLNPVQDGSEAGDAV